MSHATFLPPTWARSAVGRCPPAMDSDDQWDIDWVSPLVGGPLHATPSAGRRAGRCPAPCRARCITGSLTLSSLELPWWTIAPFATRGGNSPVLTRRHAPGNCVPRAHSPDHLVATPTAQRPCEYALCARHCRSRRRGPHRTAGGHSQRWFEPLQPCPSARLFSSAVCEEVPSSTARAVRRVGEVAFGEVPRSLLV